MREILFKGKRADNGEWVEGIYTPCGWNIYGERTPEPNIMIISENGKEDGLWVEIIPETVGQYTGLTDKNGRKIFEGDIVEYSGTHHQVVFEKRWSNAYFGIVMNGIETWGFSIVTPANRMEVIGNIHDNPELLGGDAL